MRDDITGNGQILLERVGFPAQRVRALVNEALIFDPPSGPARSGTGGLDGTMTVEDGKGGV